MVSPSAASLTCLTNIEATESAYVSLHQTRFADGVLITIKQLPNPSVGKNDRSLPAVNSHGHIPKDPNALSLQRALHWYDVH